MKVLFVSNDPTIFDETSASRARMRTYALLIGELHIVSVAKKGAKTRQEGNLFLHPVFPLCRLLRVRTLSAKAHAIIKEYGIEVVSAQDPFEHGLAALRAIAHTKAKLHIQVHTDFLSPWFVRSSNARSAFVRAPLLNRYRLRIAEQVLPAASGIRVVSERIKSSLLSHFGTRIVQPVVIPVVVAAEAPEQVPLPAHPKFTFALVTVSRLEPEKRIEDILMALKLIAKKYPMVGLFIIGAGSQKKHLLRLVNSLGLHDKVVFLGERADARGLMKSAHAFIQASAYEGYGRTLVEAALAKVPIITTDVGIVGEVFRGYEEVLSTPVADPATLALHIERLVEDNTARREFAIHAEVAARKHLETVGDIPTRIALDLKNLMD